MKQRKSEKPNPFINEDTFKVKSKMRIIPNEGGNEVYTQDGEVKSGIIGFVGLPKRYDGKQFTKVFSEGWETIGKLNTSALKVMLYFVSKMDYTDTVEFVIGDCMKFTGYKDRSHIYKAIAELVERNVIAKADEPRVYFINPLLFYRGDRLKLLKF